MGFSTVQNMCLTENSLDLLVSPNLGRINDFYLPTFELASVRLRRAIRTWHRLLGPKTTYSKLTTCPMRVFLPDLLAGLEALSSPKTRHDWKAKYNRVTERE